MSAVADMSLHFWPLVAAIASIDRDGLDHVREYQDACHVVHSGAPIALSLTCLGLSALDLQGIALGTVDGVRESDSALVFDHIDGLFRILKHVYEALGVHHTDARRCLLLRAYDRIVRELDESESLEMLRTLAL
jgi:hypothetical protein